MCRFLMLPWIEAVFSEEFSRCALRLGLKAEFLGDMPISVGSAAGRREAGYLFSAY